MNTKDYTVLVFGLLSLAVAIGSVIFAVHYRKTHSKTKSILTAWQVLTIGFYFAVVLQYLPVYYQGFEWGKGGNPVSPFCLSVFQSFRVFILDAEYGLIYDLLEGCIHKGVQIGFAIYTTLCFIAAPALTAGFVLSMFGNLTSALKFRAWKKRTTYVMSKLNEKSVVLARSIRENANKKGQKATIVFADVVGEEDEEKYELRCEVLDKDIRAICLKHDVTNLNLNIRKGKVEIFLIGDDESENIEHAVRLTEMYKDRANTSIFVYATSVGSAYIIDSLNKGDLFVSEEAKKQILNSTSIQEQILFNGFEDGEKDLPSLEGGFKVSRVDNVYSVVLNTFMHSGLLNICKQAEDKTISILIVGMGEYGKQILKTAIWFCQAEGYKLEINVIDSGVDRQGRKRDILSVLGQECPEIISMNPNDIEGDANYDIRFFDNVDCFSSNFDNLFKSYEFGRRLKRTKMAFVATGDDDKNIEVAIMLRKLFDRLNKVTNKDLKRIKASDMNDMPIIYSIVYDDKKAENLNVNKGVEGDNYLVNYKGTPYHIRFIGSLSSQYTYDAIVEMERMEKDAFCYHIDWVKIEKNIRDALKRKDNEAILKRICKERGVESVEELTWNDSYLYGEDGKFDDKALADDIWNNIKNYMKYEYYKNSSISKAVHKNMLLTQAKEDFQCLTPERGFLCTCANCERRRRTEHMRWNAYMRTQGYIYGSVRSDRGLVHTDLKPFDKLDVVSQYKD